MQTAPITRAEFARLAGYTKGRISQLTKPGEKLYAAMTAEGLIDAGKALRLLGKHYDPLNAMSKAPSPRALAPVSADEPDDDGLDGIAEHKARKLDAEASLKELALAEKAGTLVDRATLKASLADQLASLFEALRESRRLIAEQLVSDGVVPPELQVAAQVAAGAQIDRVVEDFRQGLIARTNDA